MVDGECFWPEKVSVGEVVYLPGGTFGPRQQRNLQLVMDRSGHLTIWIDGMPRTATANTVGCFSLGMKSASLRRCEAGTKRLSDLQKSLTK